MASHRIGNLAITLEKKGASHFTKGSYPFRVGTYAEIKTSEFEFRFNLKGEIKFIRGLNVSWPHPSECLKRTDGNDWVYYSVSVHEKIISWMGEYYLPCLPYPSNTIREFNPYTNPGVAGAFAAWSQLYADLYQLRGNGVPSRVKKFLDLISEKHETALHEQSKKLHAITGERASVLPPDTRRVDYEVIPLMIADGCLYHCKFCSVQSSRKFQPRAMENIREQIRRLKDFYGPDLPNYKGLFLGNHDALGAGEARIRGAVSEAVDALGFGDSSAKAPYLYLFGSVDSLLNAGDALLQSLDQLPFYTYINVGFESVDAPTLADIHKPLEVGKIQNAFQKMLDVNREYQNIEITGNFLLGDRFSPDHNRSLAELLAGAPAPSRGKGAIYLSPMMGGKNKSELLRTFFEIKDAGNLPAYIYLIQRL
ncbi:MAG: radical SAM protein [Desulfobacterales bacterium]|nr:radical SAM protein [Desulfobacterales bacterium]